MIDTFAERLKNARIMKGFSMDDLVKELDNSVSKTAIMKYEKGVMKPNSTILISLSKALEQPVDYFFRPFSFQIESISFRKKSSLSIKEQNTIKEKICDMIERYICIEEICNKSIHFIPLDYKCVSSIDQVKSIAQDLRAKWNLGTGGIINVMELLEKHGIKVLEIKATDSFDGLTTMVNDTIPVIVLNSNKSSERKRFTALHELGHLLLSFEADLPTKTKEKLCNCFASEMLLPESVFKQEIWKKRNSLSYPELASLQQDYGISCDALIYKAYNCQIISEQRYKSICIKRNKDSQLKLLFDKSLFPAEECHRFSSLVFKALCCDLITTSKAAALLNFTLDEVRERATII